MATRKMTFSLPTGLAAQFVRRVAARERSRYVAEAIAARLKERDRLLAHAADVANRSREVRKIEQEFDRLNDEIAEPWDEPAAR
jgi:ubiquinone biosynthesis protein UbiJ